MSLLHYKRSVLIDRPAAEVFAWHERDGAFERLTPPWRRVEVTARSGGIRDGATVNLRMRIGPVRTEWEVVHRDYVGGVQFRDVQRRGPFARWEHVHRFEPAGDGRACLLTDEIVCRLPLEAPGHLLGAGFARRELERVFAYRHAVTKADIEGAARHISVRPLRFLIAGASGLVGRALVPFLRTQGHSVLRLVRREAAAEDEVSWDPAQGWLAPEALRGIDAVINLAGEGLADGRWTAARKDALLRSRVDATRTLVAGMAGVKSQRLRPFLLINASATGVYGERGEEWLDEASSAGEGFLSRVCTEWEREAARAEDLGVRVVRLRTGIVLSPAGGALARMLPAFRAGVGGRFGAGRAWMSWVSIDDLAGMIYHAVLDLRCDQAVNAVAPEPVVNAEFVRTLARVLRRPALLPVPRVALRMALGEMADEAVLASARVAPAKLRAAHYRFRHASLEEALRHLLGREAD